MLNQWSPSRPLKESAVVVAFDDREWNQSWCDDRELKRIATELDDRGAPSGTLRALGVDHGMSLDGLDFRMTFAPSEYGDLVAVGRYFERYPDRLAEVMARLEAGDSGAMVAGAPASVTALNLTVTSADGKLLAVKRSSAVRTSQNVWTLGPNETMVGARAVTGGVETPFELATRCLRSEMHLAMDEVERLEMSWVGYNVPGALVHFIGHVRSVLRAVELEERISQSSSSNQVAELAWIDPSKDNLKSIVSSVLGSQLQAKDSKRWHPSAAIAAAERWRWRSVFG
jgi:hypothetical protein